jgi:hypothetical protein
MLYAGEYRKMKTMVAQPAASLSDVEATFIEMVQPMYTDSSLHPSVSVNG